MRQIKFRAWDLERREWLNDGSEFFISSVGENLAKPNEVAYMQYTGIKDKNGKEIYEGDIVKGTYPELGQIKFGLHGTSTDYYSDIATGWYIETPSEEEFAINKQYSTEIIGNIYENPELLK